MSLINQKRPLKLILTNASSFPYTLNFEANGLAVINTGSASMTVALGNGITFTVPANAAFDDDFIPFTTITCSGSTTYQVGVR